MGHCVFSYWQDAVRGDVALYHIEVGGERSTLMLGRVGERWSFLEHSGVRNRPVSDATRAATARWLEHVGRAT